MESVIKSVEINRENTVRIPHNRPVNEVNNSGDATQAEQTASKNSEPSIEAIPAAVRKQLIQSLTLTDIPDELIAQLEEQIKNKIDASNADSVKEQEQQGYDHGLEKGLDQGRQQAQEENRQTLEQQAETNREALASLVETIEQQNTAFRDDLTLSLNDLVLQAVYKLITQEYVKEELIFGIVLKVMEQAGDLEILKIRLNQDDLLLLQTAEEKNQDSQLLSNIKLVVDNQLKAGGCIVETKGGHFDGSLNTQLEQLESALNNARREYLAEKSSSD